MYDHGFKTVWYRVRVCPGLRWASDVTITESFTFFQGTESSAEVGEGDLLLLGRSSEGG